MDSIVAYQNNFSAALFDAQQKKAFQLGYAIFKDPALHPNKIVAKWIIKLKSVKK